MNTKDADDTKTPAPEQTVDEDNRPAGRKLDPSEIEDIAAGDQPIELPEI